MRSRAFLAVILILAGGCSARKLAVNELGDALAKGGTTFSADDDPELIGDALPFTLKLMESLLAESPDHPGLLLSTTSGFTQYSYGWVHQQADRIEDEDLEAAGEMRARAQRLYLRARNYGLRGLRLDADTLRRDPKTAVVQFKKDDVPMLYWTAAAWGLAISLSKDNPELVADLPIVEALIGRVAQLDETFEGGAVHSFLVAYESGRPGAGPEALVKAKQHFDRAVELAGGMLGSPYVTYAESVSVTTQNRAEFEDLLNRALAIDVNAKPEWRLANLIAQRRAKWLLGKIDDLFLTTEGETTE